MAGSCHQAYSDGVFRNADTLSQLRVGVEP